MAPTRTAPSCPSSSMYLPHQQTTDHRGESVSLTLRLGHQATPCDKKAAEAKLCYHQSWMGTVPQPSPGSPRLLTVGEVGPQKALTGKTRGRYTACHPARHPAVTGVSSPLHEQTLWTSSPEHKTIITALITGTRADHTRCSTPLSVDLLKPWPPTWCTHTVLKPPASNRN